MYKVQFTDPATGKGFIDGYKTARAAKAAVAGIMGHKLNADGKVMRAKYLGSDRTRELAQLRSDEASERVGLALMGGE